MPKARTKQRRIISDAVRTMLLVELAKEEVALMRAMQELESARVHMEAAQRKHAAMAAYVAAIQEVAALEAQDG